MRGGAPHVNKSQFLLFYAQLSGRLRGSKCLEASFAAAAYLSRGGPLGTIRSRVAVELLKGRLIRPSGPCEDLAPTVTFGACAMPSPTRKGPARGRQRARASEQGKNRMARNCSNEKRHPPRASIKTQLQLKSKSRRQGYRKEIQANGPVRHLV